MGVLFLRFWEVPIPLKIDEELTKNVGSFPNKSWN